MRDAMRPRTQQEGTFDGPKVPCRPPKGLTPRERKLVLSSTNTAIRFPWEHFACIAAIETHKVKGFDRSFPAA